MFHESWQAVAAPSKHWTQATRECAEPTQPKNVKHARIPAATFAGSNAEFLDLMHPPCGEGQFGSTRCEDIRERILRLFGIRFAREHSGCRNYQPENAARRPVPPVMADCRFRVSPLAATVDDAADGHI